jgi:hypothetical protein
MVLTILVAYGVIIALNQPLASGTVRLLLLGTVLWDALHLRMPDPMRRSLAVWGGTAAVLAALVVVAVTAPARVTVGLVGGVSLIYSAVIILVLASAVLARSRVDATLVLGVLSGYLLLALLFASLNQLLSVFHPDGYLIGVHGLPNAADQLYFSVITMTTVGFGDITPGTQVARAVTVMEALTGQLYLVSVVAAVVGKGQRPS